MLGQTYDMGYATQPRLELHANAIQAGESVLVVDDVLATGGTALAAVNLVAQTGARLVGVSVAIDIEELYRLPAWRVLEERAITLLAAWCSALLAQRPVLWLSAGGPVLCALAASVTSAGTP